MPYAAYQALQVLYLITLLAACGYAAGWGGREERTVAAIHFAASVVSGLVASVNGWMGWHHVQFGLLGIDFAALLGFGWVALISRSFWPLWVTGFHLDAVLTHLTRVIDPAAIPSGYSILQGFWAYPLMAALCVGTGAANASGGNLMGRSLEALRRELCDRIGSLAQQISEVVTRDLVEFRSACVCGGSSRHSQPAFAELIYRQRRRRETLFGDGLFADPAWDILLDLFVHHARGHQPSTSSACIGAAVPSSTALRWIDVLEQAGLVHRVEDPDDGRRRLLRLSDAGREKMEVCLRETMAALS